MTMANNTDLISEINGVLQSLANAREDKENAAGLSFGEYVDDLQDDIELISLAGLTLQRARDALRWIPCEERLPEDEGDYFVTARLPFPDMDEPWTQPAYFKDGKWHERDPNRFKTWIVEHVVAWHPKPAPYTPEEK